MAEAIREVVSSAILFEVSDPRVHGITVLNVEVAGDMRHATVFVTIMGTETEQKRAMQGLLSAAGFLQARVAARLQTRFTPILAFKRDDSVKKSIEISRLIDETLAADRQAHADPVDPEAEQEARIGIKTEPVDHSEDDSEPDAG
jgi:ribosome-binding factor A